MERDGWNRGNSIYYLHLIILPFPKVQNDFLQNLNNKEAKNALQIMNPILDPVQGTK